MNHRLCLATVAVLAFIAFAGLAPSFSPSLPLSNQAYAQTQASTAPAPSESVAKANSAPQFPSSETGVRNVDENTPSYGNIGAPVTATDPNNDTLTYSLENADTSHFAIVRSTGQLQAGAPLDYETRSSYTVKVIATDPSGATAKIPVTITVNNVDEPGTVSLYWGQPQVDTALKATLTDPDGEVSGVTWQWARADTKEGNYADISGATSATYTPVAADKHKYLRATASYTDPLGYAKTARSAAGYVKPVPDPNQTPEFQVNTSGGYGCDRWDGVDADVCVYVRRNASVGSDIYYPAHVHITDHDEVRYSLGGQDAGLFSIGPSSGTLFTTDAHAYDDPGTDGQFEITITATDPSGKSDSITVALRPSGSPGSPAVNGPEDITYPENGTWPLAVYSATASNPDRAIRGWIISVQPGGGDGDFFDMDDDGALTFTQPPDYEDPANDNPYNEYTFTIMSYDTNPPRGQRPGQAFYSVRVTVTNVDEPLEIRGPTAVDYAENGTDAVATYTAPVADGPVAWSLSGDDAGKFSISSGGVLTFDTPPDYENPTDTDGENDYLLSITVTETEGHEAKIEPVRVGVTDVNEPPTFDEGETATRSVGENAGAYEHFGDPVTATDPDRDGLTYTLENDANLPFTIVSSSGQLQVDDGLDHETESSYTVTVSVSDGKDAEGNPDDTADDTITVTISVTGVNEAPTVTGDASVSYAENGGGPVATYTGSDPESEPITWSLSGADSGDFSISSAGVLTFNASPNYEAPADANTDNVYLVTVQASDETNIGTLDVTITVTDVNEAPRFPATETGDRSVAEDTEAAQDIGAPVAASDPDAGDTLTYTLTGDDAASFAIDSSSGQLQTKAALDYETKSSYSVTVTAADPSTLSDTITVTITVTSVNDPPSFPATETGDRTVPENTAAGRDIGAPVAASDADAGDTLTYTLTGDDAASFDIDSSSGQLRTKAALDHETRDTYYVTVSVRDDKDATGNPDTTVDDTITVTVTVTDVNDAPVFPGPTDARSVAEGTPTGQNIGAPVAATDDDSGDTLTYSLSGTDAASFDIVSTSGQLQTKSNLDYETRVSYTVTVTAKDPSNASDTITVTITVTSVNEAPRFPSETGDRTVAENTPPDRNIGDPVAATDDDNGDTLTYSLSGTDAASFDIVPSSGQLRTKAALDYETESTYTVSVTATDTSNASDTITVTITVTNVEEEGTVTLSSTQPQVGTQLTASVTDPDGSVSVTTWSWKSSTDKSAWTPIASETADSYTPATGDVGRYLRATASYTDRRGSGKTAHARSANAVRAEPVSNRVPAFAGETDTRTIAENTSTGRNIGAPVAATDLDTGDTLIYSLGGTDAASFDIVSSSSQLRTKAALDYESKSSYTVTVSVHDGKDANGNADTTVDDTITATITVTDVEEEGTVTLSSTQPQVDTQLTATLKDPDGGVSGTTWSWATSSDRSSWATISNATSASYTPATGDVGRYLRATASYTDRRGSGKTARAVSANAVRAANSAPAFTEGASAGRTVAENTSAGQNIGDPVEATDDDNDDLTYTLVGTDAASFDIVSSSGQLRTRAVLDHETRDTYSVTVSVRDGKDADGNPDTAIDDTITVTITVTDVEEAGTLTLSSTRPQVDTRLTATLTDPDGSVSGTTRSWESSTDKSDWTTIGGATSATYTPATGDVGRYLRATASYTDRRGSGKTAQAVSANAVRAANSAPAFTEGASAGRTVAENTPAGQNIGAPVAATDDDSGDTLTYSLSGTDAASFDIVSSSGQLRTRAALDYETKSTYTVTVSVRDSKDANGNADTAMDDTVTVTITVTDVEEAGTVTLSSTQPQVGTALSATLTDPDGGVSGTTWSWASSSDRSSWANVTGATSASYTPVTDHVGSYLRATASYTDRRRSGKTAQAASANAVRAAPVSTRGPESSRRSKKDNPPTPKINHAPAFAQGAGAARSVAEHTTAGTDIGQPVTATDLDDDTLTYTLGGEDAASFDIVSSSGQLRTKAALDRETKSSYTVTVTATDWANTSNTISVTINVTDVDETPVVTGRSAVDYAENGTGPVATYAANDPEEAAVTWSLAGDDSGDFSINDGALTFNTSPDYELPADADTDNEYVVTVKASDGTHTDTLDVTITVTDVAEAPEPPPDENGPQTPVGNQEPEFPPTETGARSVAENTSVGEKVGLPVAASDADNDGLTYTLGGADAASFSIDLSSGQLRVKAVPDHETRDTYSVTVSVRDGKDADGNPDTGIDDTIAVTVTVTDVDEAGTLTLSAAQPQVDTQLTATLTDLDGSVSGATWLWESAPDGSTWTAIEGATSDSYTPVSDDVGSYLRATVSYTDGEGSGKTAQAESASAVQAAPVDNSPPAFAEETDTRTVAENTPAGENIGAPVVADDPDTGDDLTYSLGGDDAASFDIVPSSGQLLTKAPLDYETKSSYTVTVTASDPSNASDTIDVTITITNVDEAPVTTDSTSSGPAPERGSITRSPSRGDGGVPSTGKAGERAADAPTPAREAMVPVASSTDNISIYNNIYVERVPALLISMTMMALGASMMGAGAYLMMRLRWPQRRFREENRLYPDDSEPAPAYAAGDG